LKRSAIQPVFFVSRRAESTKGNGGNDLSAVFSFHSALRTLHSELIPGPAPSWSGAREILPPARISIKTAVDTGLIRIRTRQHRIFL